MTTDLVEKCARAAAMAEDVPSTQIDSVWREYVDQALAVIDALADGVSDEMCDAAVAATTGDNLSVSKIRDGETFEEWSSRLRKLAIAAAIRAAKSREG